MAAMYKKRLLEHTIADDAAIAAPVERKDTTRDLLAMFVSGIEFHESIKDAGLRHRSNKANAGRAQVAGHSSSKPPRCSVACASGGG